MSKLDIVIFGATGFTGKHVIPEINKLIRLEGLSLTWGIAARNEKKMKEVLAEMERTSGEKFGDVPLIIADINDEESLKKMTSQAKLIINTVGPYRFYGEPVIKACIESGTHHVDVSGETQYMELMQLKYHEAAMKKGVYLLSACAFGSIPSDLGVVFLQKNFKGTLNSVKTFFEITVTESLPGPIFHYGTWESAIYVLTYANELRGIRSKLYPKQMPNFNPKLQARGPIHKSRLVNKWVVPFIGDRSVVLRSQRFFYEHDKQRPVQMQTYLAIESFYQLLLLAMFGAIVALFCKFDFTRGLLLKHPKFFSAGHCSHEGPTEEKQASTKFNIVLLGEGWSEKLTDPNDQYKSAPTEKIMAKVSGTNPAYGVTCTAIGLSAITILTEKDKMPNGGGVYPPGAAFSKTSIIEKLNKHGMKFELLSNI